MDVTKNNFKELLPEIKQAIDDCTFVGIDTELTGLFNSKSTEHAFDYMEDRYCKNKENCSKFLIIQFGLSTFKYHPQEDKYTHKDFNFYVFPASNFNQTSDPRFICQSSSLHFLASFQFDFNKVIYEGIPYLTPGEEEKIREHLSKVHELKRNSIESKANGQEAAIPVPDEHKEFVADILKQVDSFIKNDTETEHRLEPCTGFRRRLIYESVQSKYSSGMQLSTKSDEDNKKYIHILKTSKDEMMDILSAKEASDLENVDTAVGFRQVLEYLSESKKLVLGHHMYLDILHTIEQFFYPLPENLKDFKGMCRLVFPQLLDTKYLANTEKLKGFFESTTLCNLITDLQGKAFDLPSIEPESSSKGYDLQCEKAHEAAFDAFMTCVCFVGLSRKLGSMQSPKTKHIDISSKLLSSYFNRFYIYRHHDISSLNIAGPDPEPKRDHVFHVSFPKEWKTVDLVELFLPYGHIDVHWLNNVSAFVALNNKENRVNVKSVLLKKTSKLYQIKPYAEFQKMSLPQKKNEGLNDVKRKNSMEFESTTTTCSMDQIPELDENEAEKIDKSVTPPAKKLKSSLGENEVPEVSSTASLFEEEKNW